MVSISRSLPAPTPRPEPVHYQIYLTPILHRRFFKACMVGLVAAYAGAIIVGGRASWWSLTPFSWTFFRWLVMFMLTIFPIIVLRISQLHVTTRSQTSTFHGIRSSLGKISTYIALLTYIFSSVSFVAMYLLCCNKHDKLNLLSEARAYERPRLNERFLYLNFFAVFTGVVQAVNHVVFDRAKLNLAESPKPVQQAIFDSFWPCAATAGRLTVVAAVFGQIAYVPFRELIWDVSLSFARSIYWLNRSSTLQGWPVGIGLILRSLFIAFTLTYMIEVSSAAFDAHFAENPFLEANTLTDKSADPNGTLLTGLRSARTPLTQTLAFWELSIVSKNRPDRRKLIFTDVRKPNSMWELILNECLQTLSDVEIALSKALSPSQLAPPPRPPIPPETSSSLVPVSSPPAIQFSPKLAVVEGPSPKGRKFVESIQSTDADHNPLLTVTQHLPDMKVAAKPAVSAAIEKLLPYIRSDMGAPFRQTIQNTASRVLPNVKLQVHAVSALTSLVCASLTEDEYGVVQKNVGAVLDAFYSTLLALERFVTDPPLHWTDVDAKMSEGELKLKEPEMLMEELRNGIHQIMDAFEPYSNSVLTPELLKKLQNVEY